MKILIFSTDFLHIAAHVFGAPACSAAAVAGAPHLLTHSYQAAHSPMSGCLLPAALLPGLQAAAPCGLPWPRVLHRRVWNLGV